jgi:hypothetical protein
MPEKNNKKTPGVIVDATIAANPIKNMPMLIKELLSSKIRSQLGKKDGGSVQKMKYGGKAVPVAKVKIERLKKMRDPYGESNFAHQISDGKDAYTQRVIAAMKESGQPFMYGGKVKKMRNGGSVNTTKSIQLNPKTGEPI